jgi:hypothetical protein
MDIRKASFSKSALPSVAVLHVLPAVSLSYPPAITWGGCGLPVVRRY